jgi:hypothetical protein
MTQLVVITFLDKHKHLHPITFALYDSSLARRWKKLIEDNIARPDHHYHTSFVNKTFDNLSQVLEELNDTITLINTAYDRVLPKFISTTTLDQEVLNALHEEYEMYGDRLQSFIDMGYFDDPKKFAEFYNPLWPGDVQNFELHDNFLRLNELIHTLEELTHTKDVKFPAMSVLFDIYPQQLYDTILEKDKLYLTNTFNWGRLYLGYNTLGKDWLEVSNHNDIDVIKREQVRRQERFSAETWINFSPDDDINFGKTQFEKWYDTLPTDLQQQVPINNLNELCLGRFEIGAIACNNKYFEKYNNIANWRSQNHDCKRDWNKNIFSTFTNIVSIEFIETL